MLEQIRISGLGVIDEAVVDLPPGLTVVTGETGAGKTMVMTGLAWLFGQRADSGAVRPGCDSAVVEGVLRLSATGAATERALEAGASLDEGDGPGEAVLAIARTVSATGRSRAHAGGRTVPLQVLADLAEHVVAIHGQSDQQLLVRPTAQREALDRFAGRPVLRPRADLAEAFAAWRAARRSLDELRAARQQREQEAALLRIGLAEIEKVDPAPGEDLDLAAETQRLGHADALRAAADAAQRLVSGDPDDPAGGDDVLARLAAASRSLEPVTDHDPELASLAGRLAEAGYLLSDVAGDLAAYTSSVDADPARLAAAQQRRADLTTLARRYGGDDVAAVLGWAAAGALRLTELDSDDDTLADLQAQVDDLHASMTALAHEVTSARVEAAARLGDLVTTELVGLAMPHARIEAAVRARPAGTGPTVPVTGGVAGVGPDGADEVELLLAPHPGAQARALGKGASGGELSRVMLALEVVLAASDPVPLMVFDEVDAGVGGKAAVEVGRRLARLAVGRQVLVVTHLPQVAAWADTHLAVRKSDDGRVTRSGVVALGEGERVAELARMLAGHGDSTAALTHAEELVAEARLHRVG